MLVSYSQIAGHQVKTIRELHEAELVLVRGRFRVIFVNRFCPGEKPWNREYKLLLRAYPLSGRPTLISVHP